MPARIGLLGLGFGLLRYANARTAAALARLGTPQVLFNYLGRFDESDADWASAPERVTVRPDADLGTPYLLEVNAAVVGDELRAVFTYADDGLRSIADGFAAQLGPAVWPLSRAKPDSAGRPCIAPCRPRAIQR